MNLSGFFGLANHVHTYTQMDDKHSHDENVDGRLYNINHLPLLCHGVFINGLTQHKCFLYLDRNDAHNVYLFKMLQFMMDASKAFWCGQGCSHESLS